MDIVKAWPLSILIVAVGQVVGTESAFGVGPTSPTDIGVKCGPDGVCNVNGCQNNPDPDCPVLSREAQQPEWVTKKFPCDPKFKELDNYIEIKTGSDPTASDEVYVCFGEHRQSYVLEHPLPGRTPIAVERTEHNWYDADPSSGVVGDAACIKLSNLPGSEFTTGWSPWVTGHTLDTANRKYRFAMCEPSVWKETHRYLSTDAWDSMRLYTKTAQAVDIDKVRVVQNGVRILDDALADEGDVDYTLDIYHSRILDLSWRIRNTKLRRFKCLNNTAGAPFCDAVIAGLDYQNGLPPVLETALLELGHSGSAKYLQYDSAWCSEFALYVIQQATNLSRACAVEVPDAKTEDLDVFDMEAWFSTKECSRWIDDVDLKNTLEPGDYISLGGRGHSAFFIGWQNPSTKTHFWEISGNNQCATEVDGAYDLTQWNNRVCITLREYATAVTSDDFGGRLHD